METEDRSQVLQRWLDWIVREGPAPLAQALAGGDDPFANPVRETLRRCLAAAIDGLADDLPPAQIADLLAPLMRVCAVQDLKASAAVSVVCGLRWAMSPSAPRGAAAPHRGATPADLEPTIEALIFGALDAYVSAREKVYSVRLREAQAQCQWARDLSRRMESGDPASGRSG